MKNYENAWNSKKKTAGDDRRHAFGCWPHLRKQEGFPKGEEVETWPKLEKSHRPKNYAENKELGSTHQMGRSGVCSDPPVGLTKTAVIIKEEQEFCKLQSNDLKNTPKNLKPLVPVSDTIPDEYSQKSSLGNSDKMALSRKEEKTAAFKKLSRERKEEKKVEKRRKKEDDALRKMVGPKGLKVTVIDNNVFSKFCDQPEDLSHSQQNVFSGNEVQFNPSAFPELRRSSEKLFMQPNYRSKKAQNSIPVVSSERPKISIEETAERSVSNGISPKSTKSKRRRDPVVVDIWKAIEICKAVKKEEDEEDTVQTPRAKKKEAFKIAGNILDASNPTRHRGKKREIPKKRRETRLKKAIVAERKRRRQSRICGASKGDLLGDAATHHETKPFDLPDGPKVSVGPDGPGTMAAGESRLGMDCAVKSEVLDEKGVNPRGDASMAAHIDRMTKDSLHSRSFRDYCDHVKSSDITESVKAMLRDILKFQDRLHATQPIKAESHRRYVLGLRQTQHLLAVHKVKIVILAQDLEKVPSPGGLDDVVNSIIDAASGQGVPVAFPLTRRQLGAVTYRKVGVSCVGVLNYQGSEENFRRTVSALGVAREAYRERYEGERLRITMETVGAVPTMIKEEKCDVKEEEEEVVVRDAGSGPAEGSVTQPLLQKLTEALSELSASPGRGRRRCRPASPQGNEFLRKF